MALRFIRNHQFNLVVQSYLTLCDPMHARHGMHARHIPVHHQLPESTQTHVH